MKRYKTRRGAENAQKKLRSETVREKPKFHRVISSRVDYLMGNEWYVKERKIRYDANTGKYKIDYTLSDEDSFTEEEAVEIVRFIRETNPIFEAPNG